MFEIGEVISYMQMCQEEEVEPSTWYELSIKAKL